MMWIWTESAKCWPHVELEFEESGKSSTIPEIQQLHERGISLVQVLEKNIHIYNTIFIYFFNIMNMYDFF